MDGFVTDVGKFILRNRNANAREDGTNLPGVASRQEIILTNSFLGVVGGIQEFSTANFITIVLRILEHDKSRCQLSGIYRGIIDVNKNIQYSTQEPSLYKVENTQIHTVLSAIERTLGVGRLLRIEGAPKTSFVRSWGMCIPEFILCFDTPRSLSGRRSSSE